MNSNISIDKETIDRKIDTSFAKVIKCVKTKKAALKVNKLFKLLKGLSTENKVLICSTLGECVSDTNEVKDNSFEEWLGSIANGDHDGDDDLQKGHRKSYLSEACLHALNFYRSNPSELERVVAERMQVVTNKKIGQEYYSAATEEVDGELRVLAQQYLKLNINQSTLGQCLQNYFCARIGHKISGRLNKVEDVKERRSMEKTFRLQLTDATGQSKFFKYCMNAHKMQTIVSSDALLLVEVATPDVYRKNDGVFLLFNSHIGLLKIKRHLKFRSLYIPYLGTSLAYHGFQPSFY
ncbi:hypothetical protein EDC96DRAFT_570077 [Choanephora cucurbitarum]|nr:hypothetical protein EDC96DRAFT_570343 [Choanephora cucurbitarum]KAI8326681.1 hypothetical protein EDC96DRAFT_570077 [Choanephora cucurbitarum]